jgi:Zn finger protein HypA/HybF involved in hydrogenase expression
METKLCKTCNVEKLLTVEFWHKSKRRKDGWEYNCKECVQKRTLDNYNSNKTKWNETTKKNHRKRREKIQELKADLSCAKCDESRHWLLDFHHIDPTQKDFQLSQGERYGWEKVQSEIEKCVVLCSNCHRDFHHLEKKTRITIQDYLNYKINK